MTQVYVLCENLVENFQSTFRAVTKESDIEDAVREKAKALNSSKENVPDFQPTFVVSRNQS